MPRRILTQTADLIAKETALVVFSLLLWLAYKRYEHVIEDSARPNGNVETVCDRDVSGNAVCFLRSRDNPY